MRPPEKDPVESALSLILDALASALIPLDITPARLALIARTSFVKIGAQHARMRSSGRPHLAKIAALTGLTRAEVKRIVSTGYRSSSPGSDDLPRALRVLAGWQTSATYLVRGKPRVLKLTGRAPSFDSLCKAFSGDIPRKVILDELVRQRRISFKRDRKWVSIPSKQSRESSIQREQVALAFAATLLSEALRHDAVIVRRRQKIVATRDLPDNYVEGAVADRLTELLDQMPNLFSGNGRPTRHILNAFTLVVRAPVHMSKRRGR